MKFVIDNLPGLLYIAGSLCFIAGTIVAMVRA
jgi:hypothetical protein